MSYRNKVLMWIAVLMVSHAIFFAAGAITGRRVTMNHLLSNFEKVNAQLMLGHYTTYRNIALGAQIGNYDLIVCYADLNASTYYDSLKACVENGPCNGATIKEIREVAPEVLGEAPLKFNYIKSNGGFRRCKE